MKRALLFGGVPTLAGIALIVMWVLADQAASRGNDWVQVLATIESARPQAGGAQIAYRYEFGGREHRNPAAHLTIRTSGGKIDDRYAAGRQLVAYVNPVNPAESMLEPRPRPSFTNLIAGVVLIVIGIPVGAFLLRDKQPRFNPNSTASRRPRKPTKAPSKPMSRLKPPPSPPRN